jgi:hypothetical protein
MNYYTKEHNEEWLKKLEKRQSNTEKEILELQIEISNIKDYVDKKITELTSIDSSLELSNTNDSKHNVYVYFIRSVDSVKVGYSKHPNLRLNALQTANPNRLEMIGYFSGNKYDEEVIHQDLHKHRQYGEWFNYCEDVQKYIQEKLKSKDCIPNKKAT